MLWAFFDEEFGLGLNAQVLALILYEGPWGLWTLLIKYLLIKILVYLSVKKLQMIYVLVVAEVEE